MSKPSLRPRGRYAILAIAIILGISIYMSKTDIARAGGGGAQQCTTQIGGLSDGDFQDASGHSAPITFTINYQNGASFDRTVSYTNNTSANPPGGNPPGTEGTIVDGPSGAGNLAAVTYNGVRIPYNGDPVSFTLPSGTVIYVQPNSYQGRQYATILPNLIGGGQQCTTQVVGFHASDFADADGTPTPITFTVNYSRGAAYNQTVSYDHNTAPDPPEFEGEIVDGPRNGGNLDAITIYGVRVPYDQPAIEVTLPNGVTATVQAKSYSGNKYAIIRRISDLQ